MSSALDALNVRLPAPGWAVLDSVRTRGFTGELTLIGAPAVRVWADRGRIYLAELLESPPLAARLVADGLLTPSEAARGVVRAAGREYLGALFERVPTADRHQVLVAVDGYTEAAVRTIAGQQLAAADVVPYAFDPCGVHAWNEQPAQVVVPHAAPVGVTTLAAPPVDAVPAPAPEPEPEAVAAPTPAPAPPAPAPVGAPAPAAVRAAQPAATAPRVATPAVDWEHLPYLDRLAAEREARGDAFSVIWPDGDVERRSAANGHAANGNGMYGHHDTPANGVASIAGVSAGARTRMLDDRFGAA